MSAILNITTYNMNYVKEVVFLGVEEVSAGYLRMEVICGTIYVGFLCTFQGKGANDECYYCRRRSFGNDGSNQYKKE